MSVAATKQGKKERGKRRKKYELMYFSDWEPFIIER